MIIINKLLLLVLTTLALAGCDSARLEALPHNAVILSFGDSLTSGVGTSKDKSYPTVLQSLTGLEVINAGISGEVTSDGLKRLPALIQKHSPDLMVLIEGGNDILRNTEYELIRDNLEQMILHAKARNIQVVLLGVPEKKLLSSSAPFYQELADKHKLVYEHNLISDLLRTPSLKSDPVHLNTQGYQKMAEGIHQLLLENGAL